jgi:hypothetical protein
MKAVLFALRFNELLAAALVEAWSVEKTGDFERDYDGNREGE